MVCSRVCLGSCLLHVFLARGHDWFGTSGCDIFVPLSSRLVLEQLLCRVGCSEQFPTLFDWFLLTCAPFPRPHLIAVNKQMITNNVTGYMWTVIVYFLMNIHITPRVIYLSRVSAWSHTLDFSCSLSSKFLLARRQCTKMWTETILNNRACRECCRECLS